MQFIPISHNNANFFEAETIPNDSNGNPVLVKTPGLFTMDYA